MHIRTMYPGGNAMNIAALSVLSGVEAGYLGVFGDDEAGRHVYHTAQALGIDLSMCRVYHGENGYAEVELRDGDRTFIGSNGGGVCIDNPITLTELDKEYIAGYDVCHTSVYSYAEEALPAIREASPFVSMDFSDRITESYLKKCCPYLDMAEISCASMEKEKVVEWMEKIQSYGCRQVVLATRGSLGALVLANGKLYEQSPCLVEATDTMAAGDSFITSFLIHYVDGLKTARDFPIEGGERGVTKEEEFLDLLMKTSLYQAAVFAADNCKRDGSFGFGKQF
jgi:sugar/nucleoside kinase (ribokinase family)